MFIGVANLEDGLDLQLIVTCDSSLVVGYSLSGEVNPDLKGVEKITTNKYGCGDKVRI